VLMTWGWQTLLATSKAAIKTRKLKMRVNDVAGNMCQALP